MDEKEQELTPECPAHRRTEGVLAEPVPGADETPVKPTRTLRQHEDVYPRTNSRWDTEQPLDDAETAEAEMLAILEAIVYITDEPLSAKQIADAVQKPLDYVKGLLDKLVDEYNKPHHGLTVKEVAGGYKMSTKPEHHEAVRAFVKNLNPPLKLSLAALETLAVIAYKQPITAPGDHGDPRRARRRRAQDAARSQAHHFGRPQERGRQADSVQDHQRVSGAVRICAI